MFVPSAEADIVLPGSRALEALENSKLAVILGSTGYGLSDQRGTFDSDKELGYIIDNMSFVLIKLCEKFEDQKTSRRLDGKPWLAEWERGHTLQSDLVDRILHSLKKAKRQTLNGELRMSEAKTNSKEVSPKAPNYRYEKYPNGDVYRGEWKHRPEGYGKMQFASGDRYEGEYVRGRMHGHGVYVWSSGNKYIGEFTNGMITGYGKKWYMNGDTYEGVWTVAEKDIFGTYVWGDGGKYVGQFRNGDFHGYGDYFYASGAHYKGEWNEDKKHGYGIYTYPDGSVFTGQWKYDQRTEEGSWSHQ